MRDVRDVRSLTSLFHHRGAIGSWMDNSRFEDALIFLNPANDILTLFYRDDKASENLIVEIVDVHGRILIRHTYESWNATFYDRIIISSLHEGLYFLRLRHSDEGNLKILPFVKG